MSLRVLAVALTAGPIMAMVVAVSAAPRPNTLPSVEISTRGGVVRVSAADLGAHRTATGIAIDRVKLGHAVDRLASMVSVDPKPFTYELKGGRVVLRDGHTGSELDRRAAESMLIRAIRGEATNLSLPMRTVQPPYPSEHVIVVKLSSFELDLYTHTKLVEYFAVGVGALSFPTPPGAYYVQSKSVNPSWSNPGSVWARGMPSYMPPGPHNPLGTRALRLDRGSLVIHGTPQPWTIGHRASHGCIRMRKADVERLYDIVPTGTPVFIVP